MNRPYIISNSAMSLDGKTALPSGKQLRLSSDEDMKRVHELRHQCDAVLVGIGTVLADNPKLTVKDCYVPRPKQPVRVVLDSRGRTPADALVLNDVASTIICVGPKVKLSASHDRVEVVHCPIDDKNHLELSSVLEELYKRGIRTVLVEGGGTVLRSFIEMDFIDELYVYVAPVVVGGERTPTLVKGPGLHDEKDLIKLHLENCSHLGNGILLHYKLIP